MTDSKIKRLKIVQDQVNSCIKCELHKTKTNYVFARGNPNAYITCVGEAAGEEEDLSGFPFVGRSGQLLDKTLTTLGLDVNKDIYVCNILKCRPPGNRKPTEEETNLCIGYLEEQIKIVNPKVIVVLGSTAMNGILPANMLGITKMRGKFVKRKFGSSQVDVMPTYHPSYVLRNGSSGPVYEDFKKDLESAISKSR